MLNHFLIPIYLVVALVFALCAFIKWNPGASGEWLLHFLLTTKLDKTRFRILRNIMLPTEDGATTQIDHIVVSQGGIFVIETKTYGNDGGRNRPWSCWIFGKADDREWTASYPRGRKFRFQNPIRQNFKHIAVLSECLGISIEYFKSIVAFAGMAKFKTEMPADVMHFGDVAGYILAQDSNIIIKAEQISEVAETILEWQATLTQERKASHVANLRMKHSEKRVKDPTPAPTLDDTSVQANSEHAPVCPKCGAVMTLRTRKTDGGSFWGCPSYPKCRGIRQV